MQAESEWEEDEAPTSEIIDLVDQYHRLTTQARANEATITTLKERIVAEFPEEPGEWTRTFGDLILTLGVAENWSWDEAALAVMHGAGDEVPAFLSRKMAVDKKKFKALTDEAKKPYLHALTRKPGAKKITITKPEK